MTAAYGGDENVAAEIRELRELVLHQNAQLEAQQQTIRHLSQEVEQVKQATAGTAGTSSNNNEMRLMAAPAADAAPYRREYLPSTSEDDLNHRIDEAVSKYGKENEKRWLPEGVQAGYSSSTGFYLRSTADPKFANWEGDPKKIPFELRVRGRTQLDYYNFHITDDKNHQTNHPFPDAFGGVENRPDFSALEVKRLRLIFEGHAFDPELNYRIQLNGDTRGLPGFFNNNHIVTGSPVAGGAAAVEGGGVTIDHAVRLFEGWVSYNFKGDPIGGESLDPCCPFDPNYRPTYTIIGGKLKLLGPLEEYLGSGNEQFVEYSAASWFFSPDDDNLAMAAGVQAKMLEDRLYAVFLVNNGSESNFSAGQLDNWPGINIGAWYDFGGTWDEEKKKWKLFGDSMSDIDTSQNLVVRLGGAASIVPMNHRALYGDPEQSRFRTVDGGARVIDVLNGAGDGLHAVDRFDSYIFNLFAAAKLCGLSISNEWWFRLLNDFDTVPAGGHTILYRDFSTGTGVTKTFTEDSLTDFGMQLQGGYFIVPETLEAVARWSRIWGDSGNVNGEFSNNESFNEYTVGLNWFMHRHQLKWQTDVGYYQGGNPASASAAGFLTNRDGWLFRTQLQLAF